MALIGGGDPDTPPLPFKKKKIDLQRNMTGVKFCFITVTDPEKLEWGNLKYKPLRSDG